MSKEKVFRILAIPLALFFILSFTSTPVSAATLPNCSKIYNWTYKPVEKAVRAAVVKYYTAKKLAPITIYKNRAQIVDVKLWSAGWHECLNPGVGNGGYAGAVPKTALSAVEVYVHHKPYQDMPVDTNFLVVAKTPTKGWVVVAENTSP